MNVEPLNASNVFLIGFRCTGKTSVGQMLSTRLGWGFIDTDSLLVSESGLSIKEIVGTHGWETFRKMENAVVEQVCMLHRRVVATGGGVVINDANVRLMKSNGRLVWLKATPKTIKTRMMQDQDTEVFRPSLTAKDSFFEIEETLTERNPIYNAAMDFDVETDSRRIDEICDTILRQLRVLDSESFKAHGS